VPKFRAGSLFCILPSFFCNNFAHMTPELKHRIQLLLVVAVVLAAARTGYVLYERHATRAPKKAENQAAPPLNPDYYITPKKLHAYDLKSARDLTRQPVWIKEGYRYTYYPYANRKADFTHEGGLLLPLQKLDIKDVVLVPTPESARQRLPGGAVVAGQKQVMALFDQDGSHYAVPVGTELSGDYKIYADEMFFIQDPKELYHHWPADVWESIAKHEVKSGMNELQADFAIGMGVPERSEDSDVKTVSYPNGGKPVKVVYRGGKAVEVKPA
jgi:hypothetical protein